MTTPDQEPLAQLSSTNVIANTTIRNWAELSARREDMTIEDYIANLIIRDVDDETLAATNTEPAVISAIEEVREADAKIAVLKPQVNTYRKIITKYVEKTS